MYRPVIEVTTQNYPTDRSVTVMETGQPGACAGCMFPTVAAGRCASFSKVKSRRVCRCAYRSISAGLGPRTAMPCQANSQNMTRLRADCPAEVKRHSCAARSSGLRAGGEASLRDSLSERCQAYAADWEPATAERR